MLLYNLLEGFVEIAIIQENVWVVEPPIEMPFNRFD